MVRPPLTPSAPAAQTIALGVKDNLRQVRMQLRFGARTIAGQIEAARAEGPPAPWAEPLHTAAQQVLHWFDTADRMASGLLATSPRHQQLERAIIPLARALQEAGTVPGLAQVARTWYVAWNGLVHLQGLQDVLVPESALKLLLQRVKDASAPADALGGQLVWHAVQARPSVLQGAAGRSATQESDRQSLLRTAAAFVVACESSNDTTSLRAEERLALADELVAGGIHRWNQALAAPAPVSALAREVAFTVRHL